MIQVTKPFLPPLDEYAEYLRGIWDRDWLTNNGPLLIELEQKLKQYLEVDYLSLMSNGTITLQAILQSLPRKGEILTTPFSYIATCSSILWEGYTPVFVDIDEGTFNADPKKAEAYIGPLTVGALITHCFGVPCDVEGWKRISEKHNLPVIYDAAHAFGVRIHGQSVLKYGYASSLSFHATKLYHTIEGGAVVTDSKELDWKMQLKRNFGHEGFDKFSDIGVNGKNSEVHSAMGLVNLKHIGDILQSREKQYAYYQSHLVKEKVPVKFQHIPPGVDYNFSYFPVVFESEDILKLVMTNLQAKEIFPRRYFYPALNTLSFTRSFKGDTPIAESISRRILCLPIFHEMTLSEQDQVMEVIVQTLR